MFSRRPGMLKKALRGEGSRGGKVIGHTKSGKPVYASSHRKRKGAEEWSREDHKDAVGFHEKERDRHGAASRQAAEEADYWKRYSQTISAPHARHRHGAAIDKKVAADKAYKLHSQAIHYHQGKAGN